MHNSSLVSAFAFAILLTSTAFAQRVRQFEKDGVRYQETRTTQRTPVSNVQWRQRRETVYVEQPASRTYQYQRTVFEPVV